MNRILYFSIIIWILIDRAKKLWVDKPYGNYITSAVALAMGILLSVFYHLDMLYSLELTEEISLIGEIMTGIALMGGSSCIHEIINGRKETETNYEVISELDLKDFESEDM